MMRRLVLLFPFLLLPLQAFAAAKVQEVKTPGGFTAWLVEEHALPLIAVQIAFKESGFAYDLPGKEGRATLTAAMLTEGAGDLNSQAFNEALEAHAIQFNVSTDEDLFQAAVESLSEYKEKAFYYVGLALTQPRFDEASLDRARRQNLSRIEQQQQQPGYLLSRGWHKLAFGDHPYNHEQLGLKETLSALQKSDLHDFASRYLTRENILIAVVGDITPEELSLMLDQHLGGLPAKFNPDVTLQDVTLPEKAEPVVIALDIPQTLVAFGANGLKRNDPDYFTGYVMNQILGGGGSLTAKLGEEIREKRGLAYTVASMMEALKYSASWRGQFATRNEKAGEVLKVLRDTLKNFSEQGPTEEELNDAKQYLTGSFVLHLDSNMEMAYFLINMQFNQLGRDYLEKRNAMVEAVTRQEVKDMAKRLVDPDKLLTVMVGKPVLTPAAE